MAKRRVAAAFVFWAALLVCLLSFGQDKQSGRAPGDLTYRAQSQLVQVFLTVMDGARRVTGLKMSDFRVSEDGMPQNVDHMDSEESALQVALLMDTSGSMSQLLADTQEAAVLFVDSLKPGDRVTLIPFNSNITSIPQGTDDFEPILNAIRNTKAASATRLYDAILYAMKGLNDKTGRKAIVVFSDGADTASTSSLNLVLSAASRSGYPIYTVCAGPAIKSQGFKGVLQQLADVNKGKVFLAENARQLRAGFMEVSAELRAAYVLYYYTLLQPDDRWHELLVTISDPRYKVHSRRGFYVGKTATPAALATGMETVAIQSVDPAALKVNAAAALNEVANLAAEPRPILAAVKEEAAAAAATQPKVAAIKVSARLVEVPVYLESPDGKEPPDFLEKDFQVYEDGSRREIAFFRPIGTEDLPKARDLAWSKAGAEIRHGPLALAAGDAEDLNLGRYYLVFDDLATEEGPFLRAKNAAEEIIRKYSGPLRPISVFFTSRGKATNSGSPEIESLLDEVRKAGFQSNRGPSGSFGIDLPLALAIDQGTPEATLMGELIVAERARLQYQNQLGAVTGFGDQERNKPIIETLLASEVRDEIQRHQGRVRRILDGLAQAISLAAADPGKGNKTMILISPGFYLGKGSPFDATSALERLISAAKRAGIRIFPLDTTLAAEEYMGPKTASGSAQLLIRPAYVSAFSRQLERESSLDSVALGTGGKRLAQDNSISNAIRPAISNGRFYYLAFVSRQPEDGRFHRIRVMVSLRSVRVSARQGYYARPLARAESAQASVASSEGLDSLLQRVDQSIRSANYAALAPDLAELTRRFPEKSSLWYNLGLAYLNLKNPAGAVEAFQRALVLAPEDRATGFMLARAFAATGNGDAAIETLQMLRRSRPFDLEILIQLGRAYEAASQPARAYNVYRSVLDATLNPPLDYYILLLRTSTLLGRFSEARVFLQDYRQRGGAESRIETWARQIK